MLKLTKKTKRTMIFVAILVMIGFVARLLSRFDIVTNKVAIYFIYCYRGIVYIIIFLGWGLSVKKRILQKQERFYMIVLTFLMIMWILLRSLKYYIVVDANVMRYLWYGYYVPALFIPCMLFLGVISIEKPLDYEMNWKSKLILVPSHIFVLLILTNDLHQMIFSFGDRPWIPEVYSENSLYFVLHGWRYFVCLLAYVIMIKKCRVPEGKKMMWLPGVLALMFMGYEVSYVLEVPIIRLLLGDVTVVDCFAVMVVVESCVQCGLIASNTHYEDLMKITAIPMKIVAANGKTMQETEKFLAQKTENIRESSKAIKHGSVVWQEDITELNELTLQLNENNEQLNDYNNLLQQDYEQKQKKARLEERNKLYDKLQEQTAPQIEKLSSLISEIESCESDTEEVALLRKVVIIGAYLKRKNNLVLVSNSDEKGRIPMAELERAFAESINILVFGKTHCSFENSVTGIASVEVVRLYDYFEKIVETTWDDIYALMVNIEQVKNSKGKDSIMMRLSVGTQTDISWIGNEKAGVSCIRDEDNIWYVSVVAGGVCLG